MRILAIPNIPGWALAHHCADLKEALRDECDMTIRIYQNVQEFLEEDLSRYDCIYPTFKIPCIIAYEAVQEIHRRRLLCGLHSFHVWDGHRSIGRALSRASVLAPELLEKIKKFKVVAAICRGLQEAFQEANPALAHHGINTNVFYPVERPRHKRLRIGWVGWIGTVWNRKHNYALFERLKDCLGPDYEFVTAINGKKDEKIRTREEMREFYQSLDIFVVTSLSEGSPLPPLEAAGCGVPTLTPPVGAMPEFIEDGKDGYLIESYRAEDFAEKIRFLDQNREVLEAMREACLKKAHGPWNNKQKARAWLECFRKVAQS